MLMRRGSDESICRVVEPRTAAQALPHQGFIPTHFKRSFLASLGSGRLSFKPQQRCMGGRQSADFHHPRNDERHSHAS